MQARLRGMFLQQGHRPTHFTDLPRCASSGNGVNTHVVEHEVRPPSGLRDLGSDAAETTVVCQLVDKLASRREIAGKPGAQQLSIGTASCAREC
jgi:hypothetical protein